MRTAIKAFHPRAFWTELRMSHAIRPRQLLRGGIILFGFFLLLMFMEIGWDAAANVRSGGGTAWQQIRTGLYATALPYSKTPPSWYGVAAMPGPGGFAYRPTPYDLSRRNFGHRELISIESVRAALSAQELRLVAGGFWLADVWHLHAAAVALMIPIVYLLLPITRARVLIYPPHLFRIAAYSLLIPLGCIVVPIIIERTVGLFTISSSAHRRSDFLLALFGAPILLTWWWRCALAFHLRLPYAGFAAAILVVAAWLTVCLLMVTPAALMP